MKGSAKTFETSSPLGGLQRWYAQQCDGEWEHGCGVSIGTMDNPGWALDVDLKGTQLENEPFAKLERTGSAVRDDWLVCFRDDEACQFSGRCGPAMLEPLIGVFLAWAKMKEASQ